MRLKGGLQGPDCRPLLTAGGQRLSVLQHQHTKAMFEHLDPALPTPLYAQLAERLRAGIAAGDLAPGELLPSVRQLAVRLRLNPGTVVQAYRDLETAGLVELRQGSGTYVRELTPSRRAAEQAAVSSRLANEMLARAVGLGLSGEDLLNALRTALGEKRR